MLRSPVVAAVFALTAVLAPLSAQAAPQDIYIGVSKSGAETPMVVFIFSDSEVTEFSPVDAFSIELVEEANNTRSCSADFDADWTAFDRKDEPIYGPGTTRRFGPNKDRTTIDFDKLPSYFAREAVAEMLAANAVADEREAVPYFNCVGRVWAAVLSQTEQPQ